MVNQQISLLLALSASVLAVDRPETWTENHKKGTPPNYDLLFPDNPIVHRIDIIVDASTWESSLAQVEEQESMLPFPSGAFPFGKVNLTSNNNDEDSSLGDDKGEGGGVVFGGMMPPLPAGGGMAGGFMLPSPGGMSSPETDWFNVAIKYAGDIWTNVAMRFRGNTSLKVAILQGLKKLSLRLNFDKFEDDFPEIKNQRFFGFKKLLLLNAFGDETMMRGVLASQLYNEFGVKAPKASFAAVYITLTNSEGADDDTFFAGIYTLSEDVTDQFIEENYANDEGSLYKPSVDYTLSSLENKTVLADKLEKEEGDPDDFSDYEELVKVLHDPQRTSNPAAWRHELQSVFDVESFLRVLAVNLAALNKDALPYFPKRGEIFLYNDDGVLTWIPRDMNELMWDDSNGLFGRGGGFGGLGGGGGGFPFPPPAALDGDGNPMPMPMPLGGGPMAGGDPAAFSFPPPPPAVDGQPAGMMVFGGFIGGPMTQIGGDNLGFNPFGDGGGGMMMPPFPVQGGGEGGGLPQQMQPPAGMMVGGPPPGMAMPGGMPMPGGGAVKVMVLGPGDALPFGFPDGKGKGKGGVMGGQSFDPLKLYGDLPQDSWPLYAYILQDSEYHARFVSLLQEFLAGPFAQDKLKARVAEIQELLEPWVQLETPPYSQLPGGNFSLYGDALKALERVVSEQHDMVQEALALDKEKGGKEEDGDGNGATQDATGDDIANGNVAATAASCDTIRFRLRSARFPAYCLAMENGKLGLAMVKCAQVAAFGQSKSQATTFELLKDAGSHTSHTYQLATELAGVCVAATDEAATGGGGDDWWLWYCDGQGPTHFTIASMPTPAVPTTTKRKKKPVRGAHEVRYSIQTAGKEGNEKCLISGKIPGGKARFGACPAALTKQSAAASWFIEPVL
jgi:hypothetical protein